MRAIILVSAPDKALAKVAGSAALKKSPRLLTAACQRSFIFAASLEVGSGHASAPDGNAESVPSTPKPTVKLTICCQKAGSDVLVGTMLGISVRRSFFQKCIATSASESLKLSE